jgi:tetratricopeptide (TPR) repeat protein
VALGLIALAVAIAAIFMMAMPKSPASDSTMKRIAVLPFKPLAAETCNESLELGMADTLINKLSGIRQLIVRPLSDVRKYARLDQSPVEAGRELGVDYVLEGNLQYDKAIELFLEAIEKNPSDAFSHFRLGETYVRNDQRGVVSVQPRTAEFAHFGQIAPSPFFLLQPSAIYRLRDGLGL